MTTIDTGKRALLYAHRFLRRINELSDAESKAIIGFLGDHVKERVIRRLEIDGDRPYFDPDA